MSRYLVTGTAGFIGAQVTTLLLDDEHEVIGIDDLNDAYDPRLKEWRVNPPKKWRVNLNSKSESIPAIFKSTLYTVTVNGYLHNPEIGIRDVTQVLLQQEIVIIRAFKRIE